MENRWKPQEYSGAYSPAAAISPIDLLHLRKLQNQLQLAHPPGLASAQQSPPFAQVISPAPVTAQSKLPVTQAFQPPHHHQQLLGPVFTVRFCNISLMIVHRVSVPRTNPFLHQCLSDILLENR
jgi:hypothetical protein